MEFKAIAPTLTRKARQNLVSGTGAHLSADGADWLVSALDPYHDVTRMAAGYPDANSGQSVVTCHNWECNITKPAASAGNWDCHVFTTPFDYVSTMYEGSETATGCLLEGANSVGHLGLVTVAKADAGQPLFPNANPFVSTNFNMVHAADFWSTLRPGANRIIGWGLELIDTTAKLNQQGGLTAYRMPQVTKDRVLQFEDNAGPAFAGIAESLVCMSPPATVAQASKYRDTVQWDAPQGAYVVVGQNGVENEVAVTAKQHVAIYQTPDLIGGDVIMTQPTFTTGNAFPAMNFTNYTYRHHKTFRHHQCTGVFLTGLANTASFKLRMRFFVENFPRHDDNYVVLANPSPALDTAALELYSSLISVLPPAVPVSNNAKGDWWRLVYRLLKLVGPTLGAALSSTSPAIGSLVTAASRMLPAPKPPVQRKRKGKRKV